MSSHKLILIVLLIAMTVAFAGCASPSPTVQPTEQPTAQPVSPTMGASPTSVTHPTSVILPPTAPALPPLPAANVTIKDFTFSPTNVTIASHGKVTWTNDDGFTHTISFTGEQAQSVGSGASYTRTFDNVGTYDYICSIHPSMSGKVIVK